MEILDRRHWDEVVQSEGSISFPVDRRTMIGRVLFCLLFSLMGIGLLFSPGPFYFAVAGMLEVVVFGLMLGTVIVYQLLTRRPILTVDLKGIRWGKQSAEWHDVVKVRAWNGILVVVQLSPDAAARNLSVGGRVVGTLWRRRQRYIGVNASRLPANNGYDPLEMAAWLESVRSKHAGQLHHNSQ